MDNAVRKKLKLLKVRSTANNKILSIPHRNLLYNELVLQVVFRHLDVPNAKAYRLVNKLWAKEGFDKLRRTAKIKLESETKIEQFLNLDFCEKFVGFEFEICSWNGAMANYFNSYPPKYLNTYIYLGEFQDSETSDLTELFRNLLANFSSKLRNLKVMLNAQVQGSIEQFDSIQTLDLKNLTAFSIYGYHAEKWLTPLWLRILKNSPKLKDIIVKLDDDLFWKQIPRISSIKNVECFAVPSFTDTICNAIFSIPNFNLKKLRIFQDCGNILRPLEKYANSLEYLNFSAVTVPDEFPLVIQFPKMPKLKVLGAGNSQISFPTILEETLPALEKIQFTYWNDFKFYDGTDITTHWRHSPPHPNVKSVKISFTEDIVESVDALNWDAFIWRVSQKFPKVTKIKLFNVMLSIHQNPIDHLGKVCLFYIPDIANVFRSNLKELRVKYYSWGSSCDSRYLFSGLGALTNLEVLYFNAEAWSLLWKIQPEPCENVKMEDLLEEIQCCPKLRILSLPWVEGFSFEKMFGKEYDSFPQLEKLEIIGGHCLNRFERAKLRKHRPEIILLQFDCLCEKEFLWCDIDEESHLCFERIFHLEDTTDNQEENV